MKKSICRAFAIAFAVSIMLTTVIPASAAQRLRGNFDPLLTQNGTGAGRSGRKQWKIRRANGGKKHKSEPK